MNDNRNGKVARLPKPVRDIVSQMIEDSETAETIIHKLEELGYPGFNHVNIHKWKYGGFRDWQTDRLAEIREDNLELLSTSKNKHNAYGLVTMRVAAMQFHKVLMDFDPAYLRRRMAKHPESYFQLILAYSRLLNNTTRLEDRVRLEAHEKRFLAQSQRNKNQADTEAAEQQQEEGAPEKESTTN